MKHPALFLSAILLTSPGSARAELEDAPLTRGDMGAGMDISSFIDACRFATYYTTAMDMDDGPGEIALASLQASIFLKQPIRLGDSMTLLSYLDYSHTSMDVDGPVAASQFGAMDLDSLQRVSLSVMAVHHLPQSRWFTGFYATPSLRSDFEHVDGDDFFVALALGAAYQLNDQWIVGLGVYGSDLSNDPFFIGGPGFVWVPDDHWLVSFYGPRFVVRRKISDDSQISLVASNHGGYWNVDDAGGSSKVDLRSWRVGINYKHRISGELWLETGAGFTLANEVTISTPDGSERFSTDMDSAPYVYLGLMMHRW